MQQGIAPGPHAVLVAERCGPHVLIRRRDELASDHGFLSGSPGAPEQLFVLVTAGAQRDPAFVSTVCDLLRSLPGALSGVKSVWLGATGLASDATVPRSLARELDVDVCVPDGAFVAAPGAAMYAGHGMGGTGWLRHRAEGPAELAGTRFPLPPWESAMPVEPMTVAGAVVEPIPAGALVRAPQAGMDNVVFGVAVDHRFPKIVVGGTGSAQSPAAVAAVLDRLSLKSFFLVPAAPEVASHLWQVELALLLSRDVVFGTGVQPGAAGGTVALDSTGTALFHPFPTVLRQAFGGGDQEVLDIAPAPPGWVRHGPRTYRFTEGGAEVLADVVPSGLVLRSPESPEPAEPASFDPAGWTLNLGVRDEVVGLPVLVAAERLLAGLGPKQRAVVRVRVAGLLDEQARAALSWSVAPKGADPDVAETTPLADTRTVAEAGVPEAGVPEAGVPEAGVPEAGVPERRDTTVVERPVVAPEQPVVAPLEATPSPVAPTPVVLPPVAPSPVAPPLVAPAIMTMSSAPVSTMSGMPRRSAEPVEAAAGLGGAVLGEIGNNLPAEILSGGDEPAVFPASGTGESVEQPGFATSPAREPVTAAAVSPADDGAAERSLSADEPSESRYPASPSQPPLPVAAGDPAPAAVRPEPTPDAESQSPLVIADRPSTLAEQSRFTAAAGEAFGEALATVNAALATWPSMRQENTPGVKADYVAVCLYLGRNEGNTAGLNGAVRAGHSGPVDSQLPCLVSGIRRLPTHRRAVLRQGKVGESLEHRSAVGSLLTEPGFLTASMDLDVTMPGADLDVLIWPSSARRTSELLMSHPLDEAVFLAGARFKALAVRTVEESDEEPDGGEGAAAPKVAVLYRELAPGETPSTAELDARDLAVLVKLDRVLAARQKGGLRLVEDPDAVARLTTSMVEWSDRSSVPGRDFRATLAAS